VVFHRPQGVVRLGDFGVAPVDFILQVNGGASRQVALLCGVSAVVLIVNANPCGRDADPENGAQRNRARLLNGDSESAPHGCGLSSLVAAMRMAAASSGSAAAILASVA
jgi:hypothetical protein